jgi:hypothetical protein
MSTYKQGECLLELGDLLFGEGVRLRFCVNNSASSVREPLGIVVVRPLLSPEFMRDASRALTIVID